MTNEQFDKMMARKDRLTRLALGILLVALLLLGIASVGIMTKQDNDSEQELYCKLVHEGVYQDYNGSYKANCLEGKVK